MFWIMTLHVIRSGGDVSPQWKHAGVAVFLSWKRGAEIFCVPPVVYKTLGIGHLSWKTSCELSEVRRQEEESSRRGTRGHQSEEEGLIKHWRKDSGGGEDTFKEEIYIVGYFLLSVNYSLESHLKFFFLTWTGRKKKVVIQEAVEETNRF